MHSPFVYFADDRLSTAELSAAAIDGHLVALGEGYLVADSVETPAMRAASLGCLVDDRYALGLLTAAWVWGAQPAPPARHTLYAATGRRTAPPKTTRVVMREVRLLADDLAHLGGVAVTTPQRTLLDLARVGRGEHRRAAAELARTTLVDVGAALAYAQAERGKAGMRQAQSLLSALVSTSPARDSVERQVDVTR